MHDPRETLAYSDGNEILSMWSGAYLCLLAKYLKLSRQYLVTVLAEQVESRPFPNEKMAEWALRFTNMVLIYYEKQFCQQTALFSKLNLSFTEHNISINARCLYNCINKDLSSVAVDISKLQKIRVLLNFEQQFPKTLLEIQPKPALLFYIGKPEHLKYNDIPTVGIVGSRKMTSYGESVIKQIISNLSLYQINIASGLAYGCDITAHRYSLTYGVLPIAVLPNGLACCYPSSHKHELTKIEEEGVAFSEFLPWQEARPSYFATRNRLISGLSQVILVIEAAEKSGSLITASFAVDQGREVLAVPGAITQPYSRGCNRLILDGCQPYINNEQIMLMLNSNSAIYPLTLKNNVNSTNNIETREANLSANIVTKSSNHVTLAALICQVLQENVSMLSQDLFSCVRQERLRKNMPDIAIEEFMSTLKLLELSGKVKKQRMQYYLVNKDC